MAKLILIRHSEPEIIPGLPAAQWKLSQAGRLRCEALSETIGPYTPGLIISSIEPKAVETARIVAENLGLDLRTFAGLHEHQRANLTFTSQDQFEAGIRAFFERPDELAFGAETASQAVQRFSEAIALLEKEYPGKSLAVVTHGTVMTLFVAQATGVEPFAFWKKLGLPAFVVFSLPGLELVNTTENVAKEARTHET